MGRTSKGCHVQSLQRLGGVGALIAAGTSLVGLAMFAALFTDFVSEAEPDAAAEFIADNRLALHLWCITIMIVFGIALVPLVLAVGDRLREAHSPLARVASVFGLIWSGVIISAGMITNIAYAAIGDLQGADPELASTVWAGLDVLTDGLGGSSELLGGIWVLGVSIVALRERLFARWVNHLGVVMGFAGLVAVAPTLEEVGTAVGLGSIIWFIAVGINLIRVGGTSVDQPSGPRRDTARISFAPAEPHAPRQSTTTMERQS